MSCDLKKEQRMYSSQNHKTIPNIKYNLKSFENINKNDKKIVEELINKKNKNIESHNKKEKKEL